MPGSTLYRNPDLGVEITVSEPAEKMLGPMKTSQLVVALTEVMAALGANHAYVSQRGAALEIHVHHPEGWTGTMKLKRAGA